MTTECFSFAAAMPPATPAPAHDGRVGGQTAFEDLIPADDLLSFRFHDLLHPFFKIALDFLHRLQSFLLHQLFDGVALLPEILGAFVAADMDIAKGKEGGDLGKDFIEEGIYFFVGRAERIVVRARRSRLCTSS